MKYLVVESELDKLWIYHHRHFKNSNWFCAVYFIFLYSWSQ